MREDAPRKSVSSRDLHVPVGDVLRASDAPDSGSDSDCARSAMFRRICMPSAWIDSMSSGNGVCSTESTTSLISAGSSPTCRQCLVTATLSEARFVMSEFELVRMRNRVDASTTLEDAELATEEARLRLRRRGSGSLGG